MLILSISHVCLSAHTHAAVSASAKKKQARTSTSLQASEGEIMQERREAKRKVDLDPGHLEIPSVCAHVRFLE